MSREPTYILAYSWPPQLKPNVVVMDLSMPGSNGFEATRRIAALGLDTKVLVLTVHAEEEYLVPVVETGASGYLTKTSADTDLLEALRVVARIMDKLGLSHRSELVRFALDVGLLERV